METVQSNTFYVINRKNLHKYKAWSFADLKKAV